MSIGLLSPAALAALAALALPLLIHLTRRSERQLLDFAALRWLRAKERARRRLRIDEWPLLALRLLLLAAVVLLLAQPVRFGASSQRPWVVVVPGANPGPLANDPALRDASWHWLAPGFPAFDRDVPQAPTATASLLRELDATLAATQSLTAIVPEQLAGLDAERIRLSRRVDWRIVESRAVVAAGKPAPPTHTIAIRHDPAHAAISRYFTAAARAWNASNDVSAAEPSQQRFLIDSASSGLALPANSDWLLWLSSAPLPPAIDRWLAAGGSVLRTRDATAASDDGVLEVWRSTATDTWLSAQRSGKGRLLIVHGALDPAHLPELLDPGFPDLLRSWLSPPVRAPDQALANDVAPTQGTAGWTAHSTPLREPLIWLIAAVWLFERILATNRRKAARP